MNCNRFAEGDLTQEATVTEDITGAIADSVNYTVEELRQLVGSVQNTVTRVAQTTAMVDNTSTELLAASTEQLREFVKRVARCWTWRPESMKCLRRRKNQPRWRASRCKLLIRGCRPCRTPSAV